MVSSEKMDDYHVLSSFRDIKVQLVLKVNVELWDQRFIFVFHFHYFVKSEPSFFMYSAF